MSNDFEFREVCSNSIIEKQIRLINRTEPNRLDRNECKSNQKPKPLVNHFDCEFELKTPITVNFVRNWAFELNRNQLAHRHRCAFPGVGRAQLVSTAIRLTFCDIQVARLRVGWSTHYKAMGKLIGHSAQIIIKTKLGSIADNYPARPI